MGSPGGYGVPELVADAGTETSGGAGPGNGVVAASSVAGEFAAGHEGGVRTGRGGEAGDAAYVASFVCDASAGGRDGYPHGAGFVGASGRGDDADLYARHAEAGDWSEESVGWVGETENRKQKAESGKRKAGTFNVQRSTSKGGMGKLENEARGDAHPTGGEHSTFNFQLSTFTGEGGKALLPQRPAVIGISTLNLQPSTCY